MPKQLEQYIVTTQNAPKIIEWLRTRGGLALWRSINLSNPGKTWTTPLNDKAGVRYTKPSWESATEPYRIITDPAEVFVSKDVEVKRFRVGIYQTGPFGMTFKVTDGGTRRIRKEVSKAGENAYHVFDYETQEAVIMKPESIIPLAEFDTAVK